MLLWSKGLGTKTLTMNLGEGVPQATPDALVISGTIKHPVWWDYLITMTDKDIQDVLQVAVTKETVAYLQSVKHPWRIFGRLVMAAVRFFLLWMSAAIVSPFAKSAPNMSDTVETDAEKEMGEEVSVG